MSLPEWSVKVVACDCVLHQRHVKLISKARPLNLRRPLLMHLGLALNWYHGRKQLRWRLLNSCCWPGKLTIFGCLVERMCAKLKRLRNATSKRAYRTVMRRPPPLEQQLRVLKVQKTIEAFRLPITLLSAPVITSNDITLPWWAVRRRL